MSDTSKFAEYASSMKKCRKIFNVIPIAYAVISILYLFLSFVFIIAYNLGAVFALLDGLIFAPTVCYLGFRGAYHRHDLSAIAVPVLSFVNMVILKCVESNLPGKAYGIAAMNVPRFCFYVCLLIFMASSFMAYINIKANNRFRFLEKQVGFPLFNERAEEQRVEKIRREIKDPFQVEYERRMRTASSEMDSIVFPEQDSPIDKGN